MFINIDDFYKKPPIVSWGIICYKKLKNDNDISYLMIQRKDTIGFSDFIRGKYTTNNKFGTMKYLIEEMTEKERKQIQNLNFKSLWSNLWVNHNSKMYKNNSVPEQKFNSLDIKELFDDCYHSKQKWSFQEIEFPKGRRKHKETGIQCAIREFQEETGIQIKNISISKKRVFIEEYKSSNGLLYRHIYYLAQTNLETIPKVDEKNIIQSGEVKNLFFLSYKTAMNAIRSYSVEKRNLLFRINKFLQTN
jgi:ADP-ribose pyrophosphatase YjhB (NUDIX family)